jgi:hypothetical protein
MRLSMAGREPVAMRAHPVTPDQDERASRKHLRGTGARQASDASRKDRETFLQVAAPAGAMFGGRGPAGAASHLAGDPALGRLKGLAHEGPQGPRGGARSQAGGGVVGRVGKVPVGSYLYWHRRREHFDLCRVEVFLLEVDWQLSRWKEKGQCQARWFEPDEAARAVQETNLVALIEQFGGSEIVGE